MKYVIFVLRADHHGKGGIFALIGVLHEKVVLLTVLSANVPYVPLEERVRFQNLGLGFSTVVAQHGFMQRIRVPEVLEQARALGLTFNEAQTTYYLGRLTVFTDGNSGMSRWRKNLFAFMTRNASPPAIYSIYPPTVWSNSVRKREFNPLLIGKGRGMPWSTMILRIS